MKIDTYLEVKHGAKWDVKEVAKMDAILDANMVLTGMSFKKQNMTLVRKQNRMLFRKQTLMLFMKKSWMLFWKQKNRRYFGRHKGCYLGSKKYVFETL